jgi:hypothetical protein
MKKTSTHSERYYLLDASAFCRFVIDDSSKEHIHNITSNAINGYFYYIPQFCIAEVFNTFAKWHYTQTEKIKIKLMKNAISNSATILKIL